MKKVKIINGIYGYRPDKGYVMPVSPADGPITLSDEEAARLVNLGVAAVVENGDLADTVKAVPGAGCSEDNANNNSPDTPVKTGAGGEAANTSGVNTSEEESAEEGDAGANDNIPYYSVGMKPEDLRELMKAHNLPLRRGMSKADMVADLDKCFRAVTTADEDEVVSEEAPPELTAEDPVA